MHANVHLIGSVPMADARTVFEIRQRSARTADYAGFPTARPANAAIGSFARACLSPAIRRWNFAGRIPTACEGPQEPALPAETRQDTSGPHLRQSRLRRHRAAIVRRLRRPEAAGKGPMRTPNYDHLGACPFGDLAVPRRGAACRGRSDLQCRGAGARSTRSPPACRMIRSHPIRRGLGSVRAAGTQ